MINERNSGLTTNPSTSNNMSYGDPIGSFERMNLQTLQSPTEVHPYYLSSFYQPLGSFDDHNQWTGTDLTGNLATGPGTIAFHPSMYAPSPPFDASQNSFDYSSTTANYSHFHHPAFSPASTYSGPTATSGTSNFDIPWNSPNIAGQHQQIQLAPLNPIGSNPLINEKNSIYDPYSSSNSNNRMDDLLAQRMNLMELSNNPANRDLYQKLNRTSFDHLTTSGNLFSKDSFIYPANSNQFSSVSTNLSTSIPSTVQKSYALVVSSDPNNRNSFASTLNNSTSNRSVFDSNSSRQQASGFKKHFSSTQNPLSTSSDYHNSNPTVKSSSERVMNNNDNVNRRQISARTKSTTKRENVQNEILENLKRKNQYNPKDFNLNPKGARFFVIKSYSEDDVHRSIKYNIWCSTEHGNKRLDSAFREREGKGPIYLFFSVNGSGHFCGMAEMMSAVDHEHKTDVWHMSNKWQGKFEVKWIYVKDVPNQQFRHIRLENNENKPVTNSRDTQEIPHEKGKLMLKTMHGYEAKTSIFDDFLYYESKQSEEDSK